MGPSLVTRRQLLSGAAVTVGALAFGPGYWSKALALPKGVSEGPWGPLGAADALGLRLPAGFSGRLVATTGQTVAGTSYQWHAAPDGGACFSLADGGWVYVSNSEVGGTGGAGGAGMLRFASDGTIVDAGRILAGTASNCSGGTTPWGTWLSCEEIVLGQVWECDPLGRTPAVARPALGRFKHEAAVVDDATGNVYLTEDWFDGGLYRFLPTVHGDLSDGVLQVLASEGWVTVPDPNATTTALRYQVPSMVRFNRGEGAWFDRGRMYFCTTGDNRVWTYDPRRHRLSVLYDYATSSNPILTGIDNVTVSRSGDVFVAEDGGDMQLVMLSGRHSVSPFLQIVGQPAQSEITGPAFSPDGTRLYVTSQTPGTTYEITGPFNRRR